jgi:hypothetical protein
LSLLTPTRLFMIPNFTVALSKRAFNVEARHR